MGTLSQMNVNQHKRPKFYSSAFAAFQEVEAKERQERIEKRERERVEADRKRVEADHRAREARIQEEERQALVRRLSKMSAIERVQFLEEEKMLASARAMAARLRKVVRSSKEWIAETFQINVEMG